MPTLTTIEEAFTVVIQATNSIKIFHSIKIFSLKHFNIGSFFSQESRKGNVSKS